MEPGVDIGVSVNPYYVTDAEAFPSLPFPASAVIFRNGLFQTPGIDYDLIENVAFRFRPGVLANGDIVSVVTLPL